MPLFDIDWDAISTEEDVVSALKYVVRDLRMSGCVFSYTPIGSSPIGRPGAVKRSLAINIDATVLEAWNTHLTAADHGIQLPISHTFDPVRQVMSKRILPRWIIMRDLLSDRAVTRDVVAANWVRSAIQIGIREIFHTPVFTGRGEYFGLGILRFHENTNTNDLAEQEYADLNWFTSRLAWICINKLGWRDHQQTTGNNSLTARELDCLFWSAQGHTAAETADVLEISMETARKHIKNAMRKLNARNKTQAIVIAHREGHLPLA